MPQYFHNFNIVTGSIQCVSRAKVYRYSQVSVQICIWETRNRKIRAHWHSVLFRLHRTCFLSQWQILFFTNLSILFCECTHLGARWLIQLSMWRLQCIATRCGRAPSVGRLAYHSVSTLPSCVVFKLYFISVAVVTTSVSWRNNLSNYLPLDIILKEAPCTIMLFFYLRNLQVLHVPTFMLCKALNNSQFCSNIISDTMPSSHSIFVYFLNYKRNNIYYSSL